VLQHLIGVVGGAQLVEEAERGRGQRRQLCPVLCVVARQRVGYDIDVARHVLDAEVEDEELASPWCWGIIESFWSSKKFEAKMVSTNEEHVAPEVGPPMADGEHQSDEHALISYELGMWWRSLLAIERHWPRALMKYSAEARAGRSHLMMNSRWKSGNCSTGMPPSAVAW
jgi:hypothetical protein